MTEKRLTVLDKLCNVKLLVMDVDGTLTDGSMILYVGGDAKLFNVYDGLGIRLAIGYGLKIAWITGNSSQVVSDRARSLGVDEVCQGAKSKAGAMDNLAAKHGLAREEIAFIGDELNDLPAFERAGVKIAVANAVAEVRECADVVTRSRGGRGAVREAIELILKARGEWEEAVASFLGRLEEEEAGKAGPEAVA